MDQRRPKYVAEWFPSHLGHWEIHWRRDHNMTPACPSFDTRLRYYSSYLYTYNIIKPFTNPIQFNKNHNVPSVVTGSHWLPWVPWVPWVPGRGEGEIAIQFCKSLDLGRKWRNVLRHSARFCKLPARCLLHGYFLSNCWVQEPNFRSLRHNHA